MIKSLLLFLLLCCGFFAFGQEKLRLILPLGHTGYINSGSFSPDGKWLLSSSDDRTARLFEVESGKTLQILNGHTSGVYSAVFSPDGRLALTTSYDNTARIFDLTTGKSLHVFNNQTDRGKSAIFSPDGKKALTISGNTASLYDVTSGNLLQVFQHGFDKYSAMIDPGDFNSIAYPQDIIISGTFSPDGKWLITTGSEGHLLKIWEIQSGSVLWEVEKPFSEEFLTANFSSDSKNVLTACRNYEAQVYDLNSGRKLKDFVIHDSVEHGSNSALFSADRKYIVFSKDSCARMYEMSSSKFVRIFKDSEPIRSISLSPNGHLITYSQNAVRIWETASGKVLHAFNPEVFVQSDNFSTDGKRMLMIEVSNISDVGSLSVFEIESGEKLQKFTNLKPSNAIGAFCANGKLALTCVDSTIHVWEIASGKTLQFFKTDEKVFSAKFSDDGKMIQCNGKEYEVASGKKQMTAKSDSKPDDKQRTRISGQTGSMPYNNKGFLRPGWILSGFESPDGKQVLTFSDSTASLREKESGKALRVFHHDNSVFSAVLSSDGRQAITTCEDSITRLWDVESGKLLKVFHHENQVYSSIFSPDGKLFLAVMGNIYSGGIIYAELVEVSTGKSLQQMKYDGNLNFAVFSPDGKMILFTCTDHKTILWNVATGKPSFTRLELDKNEWLIYDEYKRFDGSRNTLNKLYFVCGMEVKSPNKLTNCLLVPDLAQKIIRQEEIKVKKRPVPRLEDLRLCNP